MKNINQYSTKNVEKHTPDYRESDIFSAPKVKK
jgi:hypothetical protein